MFSSSTMAIDPDMEETHLIRGWWDHEGSKSAFQSHSNAASSDFVGGFNRAEIRNINNVKESQLGTTDKVDYFSTRATIMHIKSDNVSYPACPSVDCNKKVLPENDVWRCEKCEKTFPKPEYRCASFSVRDIPEINTLVQSYIISMAVADWSGQAWLQGFNDAGLAVFGMTADDLFEIRVRWW